MERKKKKSKGKGKGKGTVKENDAKFSDMCLTRGEL